MKCPKCDGTGEMQICEMGFIGKDECDKCHGKGYLTNEEWLRQASTEELATVIYGIAMYDTLYDRIHNAFVLNPCEDDSAGFNEVMKWLKEIHDEMP